MRNIIEWTAIIGGLALAYPLIDPFTQALGPELGLVALLLVGAGPAWLTYAAGHLWDTWVDRRTCPPDEAVRPNDAELLAVPPGQTVH